MNGTTKIDHEMLEHNGVDIAGVNTNGSTGAPLGRQVTVALSPEQYERLFFQPSAPRRGDLAKRFGMYLWMAMDTASLTHSQPTLHCSV